MLKYFEKSFKLFILTELQNKKLELEIFVQIVKKIIEVEAKANLRSWAIMKNIDQTIFRAFGLSTSPQLTIKANQ